LNKIAHQLNPYGPLLVTAISPGDTNPVELVKPPPGAYPAPGKRAVSDADFEVARFNYMKKYDFAAMYAWLEQNDSPSADEEELKQVCLSMRQLLDWCQLELQNYSAQKPLVVQNDKDHRDYLYWPDPSGGVFFKTSTGTLLLPRDQIPPSNLAGIADELIRANATPDAPATQHLWRGLRFFIETYQVKSPKLQQDIDQNLHQVASSS